MSTANTEQEESKCRRKDYSYGKVGIAFSITGCNRTGSVKGSISSMQQAVHMGVKPARLLFISEKVVKEATDLCKVLYFCS